MKSLLLFSIILICDFINIGQSFNVSIILAQEPYCRTAGYQSGNGVLIATSTGGTGALSYQWYDSTFTAFVNQTNPTVVIREPGKYYLKGVDELGVEALDSIVLDSINPEANFDVLSEDFYITDPFEAYDQAKIELCIPGEPLALPPPLYNDTVYFWAIDNKIDHLKNYYTGRTDQKIDTLLKDVGNYEICLIERNFNNCRDTLCQNISIVSSLILENDIPVAVIPDYGSQTIQFHSKELTEANVITVYNIEGKIVDRFNFTLPIQTIDFNHAKGVYVFSVTLNNELESSGKFVFGN